MVVSLTCLHELYSMCSARRRRRACQLVRTIGIVRASKIGPQNLVYNICRLATFDGMAAALEGSLRSGKQTDRHHGSGQDWNSRSSFGRGRAIEPLKSRGSPRSLLQADFMRTNVMEFIYFSRFITVALWRWRTVVLTIWLVILGGSMFLYLRATPRYEAEALLFVGNNLKEVSREAAGRTFDPRGIDTLAGIAVTEDVLLDAARKVGFDRLLPNLDDSPGLVDSFENESIAISTLTSSLSVKGEGRTDLLKILFRHPDPAIAAEFANALAKSLAAKQAELLSVPGAELFFGMQKKRLEEEVQTAAARLKKFSSEFSIYDVYDQRALLLKRASEIAMDLTKARGTVAEKNGQKRALTEQLQKLTPVKKNPLISDVVRTFRARSAERGGNQVGRDQSEERSFFNDPPLLLVKVYQDSMVELFKANADLEAAINLEENLGQELKKVNEELSALASREADFERLRRDLATAVTAARTYAKRMIEEQINLGLAQARLSGVRIVQLASTPKHPASPRLIIFLPIGLIGGIVLGSAAAVLLQARTELHSLGHDRRDSELAEGEVDEQLSVEQQSQRSGAKRRWHTPGTKRSEHTGNNALG